MLDKETKQRINSARQVLVGKVPDPKAQVEQITTALIYKFMDDMDRESEEFGGKPQFLAGKLKLFAWGRLMSRALSGMERWDLYTRALDTFEKSDKIPELFRTIFKDAYLPYRDAETLNLFLKEINGFDYGNSENLGNAFEYLLSILGSQGDAGQFRTPRHIIDFIVEVISPQKKDTILDPACGTAGFLISAYKHIRRVNSSIYDPETYVPTFAGTDSADVTTVEIQKNGRYKGDKLSPDDNKRLAGNIVGYDISPDMVRLSLVNLYLHGFAAPRVHEYDTLTYEERWGDDFDIILANPPFMTPKGGIRPHKRFQVTANRSEVLFVDYIAEHLSIKGRAGIIVPEGIIFQSANAYKALRKMLVDDHLLYAVVSLPAGVFQPYSGVKTSILFLDRQLAKKNKEILFVKVENDGFDLGAQRRKIDKNDLPRAFEILRKWRKGARTSSGKALWVDKKEIGADGEYHLTGERYRKDIYEELQKIVLSVLRAFDPARNPKVRETGEVFKKIAMEAQKYHEQLNRIICSAAFLNTPKSIQNAANAAIKAFEAVDFQKIERLTRGVAQTAIKVLEQAGFNKLLDAQKKLQKELEKRQKWPMVELGEVFKIESGGTPSSKNSEYWDGNIKWATLVDIPTTIETISETKRKITKDGLKNSSAKLLPKGSVLVSSRATIGRIAVIDCEMATNQGFKNVIINEKHNSLFVAYMLSREVEQMKLLASGGTFKEISKAAISKIKIPLPPLEVQEQIVAEIEQYQKVIDGARQVVESWKPSFRIDPEWPVVQLGEICKLISGQHIDRANYNTEQKGIGYLTGPADFGERTPFISKWTDKPKIITKEGDILVTVKGSGLGKVNLLDIKEAAISRQLMAVRVNNANTTFVYTFLLGSFDYFQSMADGIAIPGITRNDVLKLQIPLPPMEVQEQIVAEIEEEQKAVDANKTLIKKMEKKIKAKIGEIWGE